MKSKSNEEKRAIVEGVSALIRDGMKVDEACAQYDTSNPTFYTYRKQLGMVPEKPDTTPPPPPGCNETDDIVDALLTEPQEAVIQLINDWIARRDELLDGETEAAVLAGTLLDHCLFDIQAALGLTEDG